MLSGCGRQHRDAECDDPYTNDICTNGDVIAHNEINYCPVTSPYSGANGTHRVWLDRNLGASKVCTDFNDTQCYGGYYQWGRDHDGHQDSNSSTTIALARYVDAVGEKFIEPNATLLCYVYVTDLAAVRCIKE